MNSTKFFPLVIFFLAVFLSNAGSVFAQDSSLSNTGFIQENIWYSKEPLVDGASVQIHTIIFNSRIEPLSGTVQFFDNEILLGKKDFSVAGGAVKDMSIDWRVTAGNHAIHAEILNSKITTADGKIESILLEQNKTGTSKRTVAKKIVPENKSADISGSSSDQILNAIDTAGAFIQEKTPDVVAKPVEAAARAVDGWRDETGKTLENKKIEAQKQIKEDGKITGTIEIGNDGAKITPSESALEKPFNYVKLFFFKLASYVFNHKILFYPLSGLLIFWLLRFGWRRIF